MLPAGKSLRTLREKLGLTMRDVENSSQRIADKYRNEEFSIPPSRLSDIETKGILPSIFRLYTLSIIYRRDFRELCHGMAWTWATWPQTWAWFRRQNRMFPTLVGIVVGAGSGAHGSRI